MYALLVYIYISLLEHTALVTEIEVHLCVLYTEQQTVDRQQGQPIVVS